MFFNVFLSQLERYNELKVLARKQSAVLSQQADKLHWEVRADQEQMAFYQRRKKEVEVLSVAHSLWLKTSFQVYHVSHY